MKITNIGIDENYYCDDKTGGPYFVYGYYVDQNEIPVNYDDFEDETVYLHRDGVWRRSTFNEQTKEYSGYFATREEADQALKGWNLK